MARKNHWAARSCRFLTLAAVALAPLIAHASPRCERLELKGEVYAGQEWRAAIGEGWIFRVVPIRSRGYSGWDLVVDRDPPAGYPDALLLATPPYNSINEREIATTYGLRAQDALGWNPRSFHFLVDPAALREGQKLFVELNRIVPPGTSDRPVAPAVTHKIAELTRQLIALDAHAASGQFRILDARLTPGIADLLPFAQNWAIEAEKTAHSFEPPKSGASTPRGEFHWIKFSVVLWLPPQWKAPPGMEAVKGACQ